MTVDSSETLPDKEINLRFKDVYESVEWKKLDPVDRAQLLLVAEGVKPGTIINGDFTHLPKIVEKLQLDAVLETESNLVTRMGPLYRIAPKEKLSQFIRDNISLKPYDKLN